MFTDEQLRQLTREVIDKAKTEVQVPLQLPATVAADSTETPTVSVTVDGDPDGTVVTAENLSGRWYLEGDRVMVQFHPPAAFFVVAPIDGSGLGEGSIVGYAQIDADPANNPVTAEEDITGLTVTVTVPGDRLLQGVGYCQADVNAASNRTVLRFKEGTTALQRSNVESPTVADRDYTHIVETSPFTATAGSHTYKLTFQRDAGAGSANVRADPTFPAFIAVRDCGLA